MEFSTQQIQMISKFASIFMRVSDIANILGVDADALRAELRSCDSPAAKAYREAKSMARAQINAQEMKLAKIGSPLGLQSMAKALEDMCLDE